MLRSLLVAVTVCWATTAWAGRVSVLGPFDTETTTVATVTHSRNPTTGLGDVHQDAEVDQDRNANVAEVFYSHFPYPPDFPDTSPVATGTFRFNFESDESDTSKQHCLRTQCVAVRDNSDFAGDVQGESADAALALASPGASFVGRFISGASSAVHIIRSDTGAACNRVSCNHTIVKCVHYRLDTMGGTCTNPSAAAFRIVGYAFDY